MKKHKKLKDEFSKKDSKRTEKKFSGTKKKKLNPADSRPPKYKHSYFNEEE
jgi:hypothetical protein